LERDVFLHPKVASYYNERFANLQVDVNKQADLERKYQVRSMTTLVFLDAKGKEVRRISLRGLDNMINECCIQWQETAASELKLLPKE